MQLDGLNKINGKHRQKFLLYETKSFLLKSDQMLSAVLTLKSGVTVMQRRPSKPSWVNGRESSREPFRNPLVSPILLSEHHSRGSRMHLTYTNKNQTDRKRTI